MTIDDNKIRRLDLSLLLIFVELMRHERTTVVARRLGLSQSAVSHALTRLRDIFDDPLFLRRSNGLAPNQRAKELAPKIEQLLRLAQTVVGDAESFDPASSDRLFRLAANDLVTALFAAPLLGAMAAAAPQARLTIRFAVGADAFNALRRDEIDLAVGRFYELPSGFDSVVISEERFVVIARRGHPAIGPSLDLATYLRLDHLLVSFVGRLEGVVDAALAREGLKRRVRASMPMFLTAFAAVAASDMIATAPARLARRFAEQFRLDLYEPPVPVEGFPLTLVRRANSQADAGLNWLAALLRRLAAEVDEPG